MNDERSREEPAAATTLPAANPSAGLSRGAAEHDLEARRDGSDFVVDGGQTRLRLGVIVDGRVRDIVEHDGFRYRPSEDPVDSTVRAVCAAVAGRPVCRIALGLTSAPSTVDGARRLGLTVLDAVGADEVLVAGDLVTAHAGALGGGPGVVITAGTGTNCLGVNGDLIERADGLGHLLGDDGSGFAIGRAGAAAALRAREGRGPATSLVDVLDAHFAEVPDFPHGIYSTDNPVAAIASFTRAVAAAARSGDAVAAGLWRQAVDQLVGTTASVVRRCFPDSADVPVSYTGRLFDVADLLREPFLAGLAARCPEARLREPQGASIDGAARLLGEHPYGSLVARVAR
jgi:N-acetylglucosamine kinase-like BadF-type ATPase